MGKRVLTAILEGMSGAQDKKISIDGGFSMEDHFCLSNTNNNNPKWNNYTQIAMYLLPLQSLSWINLHNSFYDKWLLAFICDCVCLRSQLLFYRSCIILVILSSFNHKRPYPYHCSIRRCRFSKASSSIQGIFLSYHPILGSMDIPKWVLCPCFLCTRHWYLHTTCRSK